MSHRWDCPTDWEAEREGRSAGERGRSRYGNPYTDYPGNDHCPEAEEAWDRGFRRGEMVREEEEAEERAAHRRAEARRQEAEAEEAYLAQQYEQEYYAGLEAEAEHAMAEQEQEYYEQMASDFAHIENLEHALIVMVEEAG